MLYLTLLYYDTLNCETSQIVTSGAVVVSRPNGREMLSCIERVGESAVLTGTDERACELVK